DFAWQFCSPAVTGECSLKKDGHVRLLSPQPMLGNPVRIGDGCATVTGYKLPQPLVPRERDREGGSEVGSPKSGYRFGCARRGSAGAGPTSPSKRRMRPVPEPCSGGI